MQTAKKCLTALGFVLVLISLMPSSAFAKNSDSKVLMISLPRTTWSLLERADTPNIDSLANGGSVASLSARVLGRPYSQAKGYATISASKRSTAPQNYDAAFLEPTETYRTRQALDMYKEQRSKEIKQSLVALAVNWELPYRSNRNSLDRARIGLFSETLQKQKRSIAVFGNADQCLTDNPNCFDRSIAYLGSNTDGILHNGDISRSLISYRNEDAATITTNYSILEEKTKQSLNVNDVTAVECSDLERIEHSRESSDEETVNRRFVNAIEDCDKFVGKILKDIDLDNDLVIIFSPSSPLKQEEKTVFIASGKNVNSGYATSSTTRIKGAVTLVDIAPSVLDFYGINIPVQMNNSRIDYQISTDQLEQKESFLIQMNDQALARENSLTHVNWFIVCFFAASVLFSMVSFTRSRILKRVSILMSLAIASVPLSTFLIQPIMVNLGSSLGIITALLVASIMISLALMLLAKKYSYQHSILVLSGLYLVVLMVDIIFLRSLHFNSIYGNATIVAGRFTGVNNQSFAIISIAMIIFVSMFYQLYIQRGDKNNYKLLMLLLMIAVLISIGAPQLGADVGGVLSLTPTIFVIGLMLYHRKVNLKNLIVAGVATFLLITVFALVDLTREVSQRSHLGRFAESIIQGDAALTIQRKLVASISSFSRIILVLILITTLIYLAYVLLEPTKRFFKTKSANVAVNIIVASGILLAILGAFLNDSGATIPALMSLIAIPTLIVLTLDEPKIEGKIK